MLENHMVIASTEERIRELEGNLAYVQEKLTALGEMIDQLDIFLDKAKNYDFDRIKINIFKDYLSATMLLTETEADIYTGDLITERMRGHDRD